MFTALFTQMFNTWTLLQMDTILTVKMKGGLIGGSKLQLVGHLTKS